MIQRNKYLEKIKSLFDVFPIVAVLGARQVGKSTLAKAYIENGNTTYTFYDLESTRDLAALKEAQFALEQHEGLIVIDEIQRLPELFPLLRHMVDTKNQKYLILGSASRDLIHQSTESLAGRIGYINLPPLSLSESNLPIETHLLRGSYPKSLLSRTEKDSFTWRQAYIKTFLERDLRQLGFEVAPQMMRRFWQILAHYHGQLFNASEVASTLNVSLKTAQRYLSILDGAFMVYELKPWFENLQKRQVKKSKIYFNDIGVFNALAGIKSFDDLLAHPKLGSAFEGFAINEIIQKNNFDPDDCYFWRTSNGAELDLFVLHEGKRLGFEFKFTSTPKLTKSMRIAIEDLKLDHLTVIIPKGKPYRLNDAISVQPLVVD